PSKGIPLFSTSPLNYLDWQKQNQVFEAMAAYENDSFTLTGIGEPERVAGAAIRSEMIGMLGVSPIAGRSFRKDEMEPGKDGVVILTSGLWPRRFGKDPQLVGKTIEVDGVKRTVIGIVPESFEFISEKTEVLIP